MQNDYTICPEFWGMTNESALFYRMYYVFGGEAYYQAGKETIRLENKHFYIFPVMSPYSLWQNKEDPLEVLWFHIEMKVDIFPGLVNLNIKENTPLAAVLECLHLLSKDIENQEMIAEIFDVLLTLLNRELTLHEVKNRSMKRIAAWVDEHIGEAIKVEELADIAGMERSYFSRLFKEIYKMSPQKYVLAKKMSVAARLLAQNAKISEVCHSAGYLNEKAFTRAFKKYMEISPSEYKKSHSVQP